MFHVHNYLRQSSYRSTTIVALEGEKKMSLNYTSFKTAIGPMAVAWTDRGICRLQLSEETEEKTIACLKKSLPAAVEAKPDAVVRRTIELIQSHLEGEVKDFSGIPLDLSGSSEFSRRVYAATREIRCGQVASYAEIALAIGAPAAVRAVGRALGANPVAIIVPCHRVIGKSGKMTGFSAYGGCDTKLRLLSLERSLASDKVSTVSLS
jgi:methylated-DNA-[protein]-cysteine S-methyltransferase